MAEAVRYPHVLEGHDSRMYFRFFDDTLVDVDVLSVDGIAPRGMNLSHAPGNRTPEHLLARTSVGILANAFALDPGLGRLARDHDIVTTDHYDTGGLLSVYCALNPVLDEEELDFLLEVATAGDYGCFNQPEAVRLDLVLSGLASSPLSPLRSLLDEAADDLERGIHLFQYALDQLPSLLAAPGGFRALWEEPMARTRECLAAVSSGAVRVVDQLGHLDLACFECRHDPDRRALRTVVTESRMLVSHRTRGGWVHAFTYEPESWYECAEEEVPARHDLAPLGERLASAETESGSHWNVDDFSIAPVAGLRSCDEDGKLAPSGLDAATVRRIIVEYFERADGSDIPQASRTRR